MRRIRAHLTYANVMVTILAFIVLTGGTAVALGGSNTVFSDDIANDNFNSPTQGQGGLVAADLRANSVGVSEVSAASVRTSEVANGSLNDEDIGQPTANFNGFIGTVPAHDCVDREVTGINARGDHLLLTPNWEEANAHFDYTVQYRLDADSAFIHACNNSDLDRNDGFTHFNLLVIDAQ